MAETKLVRPLRNGQMTIPVAFRRQLGIGPETMLQVSIDGDALRVKPVTLAELDDNRDWLRKLYEYFAPARAEAIERGYTEDEINEWIDEAVREVRAQRG